MPRADFWNSTPREIKASFDAVHRRLEREHNERCWLAWHIAALGRVKKMPRLDTMLVKQSTAGSRSRQPWQEQIRIMDMWVANTRARKAAITAGSARQR